MKGKENCPPHRIRETELDEIICGEISNVKEQAAQLYEKISDANLRQLIDKILIYETSEGLRIQVNLRAAFTEHMIILDELGKQNADLKVEGKYNYPFAMRRRMRVKE